MKFKKNLWASSPKRRRDDFPTKLEERGPRLLEVRETKIGADFSGYAESRVDRD